MEPAREERDDEGEDDGDKVRSRAAMEPAREERDDGKGTGHPCPLRRAAMEPAREERDDGFVPFSVELEGDWPQWSPLVKSGMTGHPAATPASASTGRNGARS